MTALAVTLLTCGVLLFLITGIELVRRYSRMVWHRRHAAVLREWNRHTSTDLDLILLYPALNVPDEERTANFYVARDWARVTVDRRGYHAAVRNLEYAYDLAISGAHRQGRSVLPTMEREEHRYAVDLRITAQDPSLPADVRRSALRKALDVLVRIDQVERPTAMALYRDEAAALGTGRGGVDAGGDVGSTARMTPVRKLRC